MNCPICDTTYPINSGVFCKECGNRWCKACDDKIMKVANKSCPISRCDRSSIISVGIVRPPSELPTRYYQYEAESKVSDIMYDYITLNEAHQSVILLALKEFHERIKLSHHSHLSPIKRRDLIMNTLLKSRQTCECNTGCDHCADEDNDVKYHISSAVAGFTINDMKRLVGIIEDIPFDDE